MSYSLIVVDMQDYFYASRGKRVRKACIREIKQAMQDQATILYVEYSPENYGPTIPQLTNITNKAKYKKVYHVSKYDNDGGQEVVDFLTKKHLPKMNLRVCGVNTNYCVRATVSGIHHKSPNSNIHVVADACDCSTLDGHKYGLSDMKSNANVKILNNKGWV